jgi:hypothetical protein
MTTETNTCQTQTNSSQSAPRRPRGGGETEFRRARGDLSMPARVENPGQRPPRVRRSGSKQTVRRSGNKHAEARGSLTKENYGITEAQWKKIEEAWSYEWPDTKACDYAGIGIGKLRMQYEKNPELLNKRDILKAGGIYQAKKNVIENLKSGDIQTTKWYLERRDTKYAQKCKLDVNNTHSLNEAQIIERLSKFIDVGLLDTANAAEPAQLEGP